MSDQQLVARIKRSSEYWGQTSPHQWFEVEIAEDDYYAIRGNTNRYRVSDVVLGMRFADGSIIDLTSGKRTGARP